MDVENFRVLEFPPEAYYIPDFISEEEEQTLLRRIYEAPRPKWQQLVRRRLQNWGGLPHPKGMVVEKLPKWLEYHVQRVADLGMFLDKAPNHVLVNEYLPGQGIMPHEDGPLFYPTIATISLGSHALLNFYIHQQAEQEVNSSLEKWEQRFIGSLLLMPRSLLILKKELYTNYLHAINEVDEDHLSEKVVNLEACRQQVGVNLQRSTRISLTIRNVPKTLKLHFKI